MSPLPGAKSGREIARNLHSSTDLRWIGTLLTWALLIAVVTGVVLLLRLAWRHRVATGRALSRRSSSRWCPATGLPG